MQPRKSTQDFKPDYANTLGRLNPNRQSNFQGHVQNAKLGNRPRIQSTFKARKAPNKTWSKPLK